MRRLAWALAPLVLAGCSTLPREAPRSAPAPSTAVPPPPSAADLAAIPDAIPRAEPRSRYGNPASYEVFGRRYAVLPSAEGYVERGTASWYGPGFHAERTSSGEPYDMYGMTAAHKTLPIPVVARVTNLRNGRSVVVRINDRGPFVGDRIVDLSYAAAWKLDMLREGTAPVELRVLSARPQTYLAAQPTVTPSTTPITPSTAPVMPSPAPVPPAVTAGAPAAAQVASSAAPFAAPAAQEAPSTAPTNSQSLQAGSFASAANAQSLVEQLAAAGIRNAGIFVTLLGDRRVYRVLVGPLLNALELDDMLERLRLAGIPNARLVRD
jgi:rare lipoprotein A